MAEQPSYQLDLSPVKKPKRFLSLQLEDLDKMSLAVFYDKREYLHVNTVPLREAHLFPEQLGTTLPLTFLRVSDAVDATTLAGRIQSFTPAWVGRDIRDIALSGFSLNEHGKPTCFMCGVSVRGLNNPGADPWHLHKQVAANCLQLRRYKQGGPRPTPPGKALRRNSAGDVFDLRR